MQNSPITNRSGRTTTPVPTREILIFRGRTGAAYNHHPQVTSLGDRLYATWSSAAVDEDAPGQAMMMSTSDDGGETWAEARALLSAQPGEHGPEILTSEGIHVHGRMLTAYCGSYEYTALGMSYYKVDGCTRKGRPEEPFHQNSHCKILVSRDRGATWNQEGRIDRFVPNLGPQAISSGRLILPGNMCFPYTDDPSGVTGWKMAGVPGLPVGYVDDPDGFLYGKKHRGDDQPLCEGSFYQTADGVIHMMLRTEAGKLAVCESSDNGATYSEPMLTDYSNDNSRFHFGRLPDGRWFGLNTPGPEKGRTPLVLAISNDGVNFDRHYVLGAAPLQDPVTPGFHKYGRYGYPSCHIVGRDMVVIYSISKEDIACVRFPLEVLSSE